MGGRASFDFLVEARFLDRWNLGGFAPGVNPAPKTLLRPTPQVALAKGIEQRRYRGREQPSIRDTEIAGHGPRDVESDRRDCAVRREYDEPRAQHADRRRLGPEIRDVPTHRAGRERGHIEPGRAADGPKVKGALHGAGNDAVRDTE